MGFLFRKKELVRAQGELPTPLLLRPEEAVEGMLSTICPPERDCGRSGWAADSPQE